MGWKIRRLAGVFACVPLGNEPCKLRDFVLGVGGVHADAHTVLALWNGRVGDPANDDVALLQVGCESFGMRQEEWDDR